MPSKMWDSPMSEKSGYQKFPGETDGPGVYNENPSIPHPTTGEFKVKFFETVPHGENLPLDSPLGTDGGKYAEKVSDLAPSSGAGASENRGEWDSPMTPKAGLAKMK